MTTITVQIDDAKAKVLREKADRLGIEPERFLAASLEDLVGQLDADFDEAASRVLSKNRGLYRRLG